MIYGVDVGARRLAVACPATRHAAVLKLKASTPGHELRQLTSWFASVVPAGATVWVEAPIVGGSGNAQTAIRLAMTVGALLGRHAGESSLVAPSTWKKTVIGNGHACKDDVRAWIQAHHPALATACAGDQDLYDATCIALHGRHAAEAGLAEPGAVPGPPGQ